MKSKPASTSALITTLAAARQAKGLSQAELASRVGMPQPQVSRLERGLSTPQLDTFQNLAGALDLTVTLIPRELGPAIDALIADYLIRSVAPTAAPSDPRPLYRIEDTDDSSSAGTGETDALA
jgi:transcriptional regulator with XRE-family HTH domain